VPQPTSVAEWQQALPRQELTLDSGLHAKAEAALTEWDDAAIAVIDAKVGAVRVLLSKGHATGSEPLAQRHGATGVALHPGSTIKPLTALFAMSQDKLKATTRHRCAGAVTHAGQTLRCHGSHGMLDLRQALVLSDNAYFYEVAKDLDHDALRKAFEQFGLGSAIELAPGQAGGTGSVPRATETITPVMAIGHGQLEVTPLQLARAYAALATGALPAATLVRRSSPPAASLGALGQGATELRPMLRAVVTDEKGTGHVAEGAAAISGKTGSAEETHDGKPRSLGWFAGWFPADSPRLAFAVRLRGGTGRKAAQVAHRLFGKAP
jgi:cell division protein FtsI/penicillin-binding protein 2